MKVYICSQHIIALTISLGQYMHRHLLQEEKPHTVDIVEGTGVRENA